MTDYAAVLSRKFPGAQWSLNGDSYEGLVWHGENKPTRAELDALWPEVQAEIAKERIDRERRTAYISPNGPQDKLMKALEEDALGNTAKADALRQEAVAMKAEIRRHIK